MDITKPLIINSEVFLECHGHCSGCFLSVEERNSKDFFVDKIRNPLLDELKNNVEKYNEFIVGFGRGNLLNLSFLQLDSLLSLMGDCEAILGGKGVVFELSTSLIGKIDSQVEKAKYLLDKNKNIYFNVVINSEIVSTNFWKNWEEFYGKLEDYRVSAGFSDNLGDILVLNINPLKLPNIDFILDFFKDKKSPFNVSLFPFDRKVSNDDLFRLNEWVEILSDKVKGFDFNIKNFLMGLEKINGVENLSDFSEFYQRTLTSYRFIDKFGVVSLGSNSIMGEVDRIRLLDKYRVELDFKGAFSKMLKNKVCVGCSYKKQCLLSGAYLNLLVNEKVVEKPLFCLSGYRALFEKFAS